MVISGKCKCILPGCSRHMTLLHQFIFVDIWWIKWLLNDWLNDWQAAAVAACADAWCVHMHCLHVCCHQSHHWCCLIPSPSLCIQQPPSWPQSRLSWLRSQDSSATFISHWYPITRLVSSTVTSRRRFHIVHCMGAHPFSSALSWRGLNPIKGGLSSKISSAQNKRHIMERK